MFLERKSLIHQRLCTRSMFFNEEGDLAHEFWEEQNGKLVKVTKGLRKQGPVTLAIPTINPSLSVVLQVYIEQIQLLEENCVTLYPPSSISLCCDTDLLSKMLSVFVLL